MLNCWSVCHSKSVVLGCHRLKWLLIVNVLFARSVTIILICLLVKRCKLLNYSIASETNGSLPSAADTYVQSTSINWLYRAVGELHSAIGLSLLQARWSGTHYRLSFANCLLVLVFFGSLLRRYYSRDISAWRNRDVSMILRYINFWYLSIKNAAQLLSVESA